MALSIASLSHQRILEERNEFQVVEKSVFVLVRVPKCGSTTLSTLFREAYPEAHHFVINGRGFGYEQLTGIEKWRETRKFHRKLRKEIGCRTPEAAWETIDATSRQDDIVRGHFSYDEVKLREAAAKFVTLLRDPVARLYSDYRYTRQGFLNKPFTSKLYHSGRQAAAGRYSFEGYLDFLEERGFRYGEFLTHYTVGNADRSDPAQFLLDTYYLVGTVENLSAFRARFEEKTGRPARDTRQNVTQGDAPAEMSAAARQRAEGFCAQDIEFYHAVTRLLAHN
ncbi:MAG: hypothetical protein EP347_12070 [Alphaproteobacteria bacterium]|nr:MAG: hypothetical protein EP347_12070 [Alphaproteobacteria bacterium]